ncbi:MAG: Uma2 family endonuclease [Pirellulaceae bacterium]|nr:Uma2 family endonuclease [Pirellulaceae bacterium]
MSHTTESVTTAEQLAALSADGRRYELVDGVLRMMSPAGGDHGEVAAELLLQIRRHAKQHHLGRTYAAETGFLLGRNPDTVIAPDVAFVSYDRLGGPQVRHAGYVPLAPDLVAEVVSPNDRRRDVELKATAWLQAGVQVVLVVDPQSSTVCEYRRNVEVRVHSDGYVDLDDVLPGFQLDVAALFA